MKRVLSNNLLPIDASDFRTHVTEMSPSVRRGEEPVGGDSRLISKSIGWSAFGIKGLKNY